MRETILNPGERIDDVMIRNIKVIQHERQFRFSLDAVLLAHFATIKREAAAVDLGTGTGIIGLLLTARGAAKVTGVELNPDMAEMAGRSVLLNDLQEKMQILNADLRTLQPLLPSGFFDLVVSNPPYRPVATGKLSIGDSMAMARHELTATLRDIVGAARYLVKYRGRFAMVHLPERVTEILCLLHEAGIEPKRLQFVHSSANKKPTMVLVEGVRGANAGVDVLQPFIVHTNDGSYTDEVMAYYK